jgi:glycosyltransferase involved in cell wall biosynthesis
VIAGTVAAEHEAYSVMRSPRTLTGDSRACGAGDDSAKSQLLSHAAALLMPVLWDEPFGIVMAEALACGTPVIGFARGAVPEVVDDGVTGFVCQSVDGLVDGVARAGGLSRAACRRAAEARFSVESLVSSCERCTKQPPCDGSYSQRRPTRGSRPRG